MRTEEFVAAIESARTVSALTEVFNREVQNAGFHSFGFMHVPKGPSPEVFFVTTTKQGWIDDYRSNGFASIDPCAAHARKTDLPFSWSKVPLPRRQGVRKPAALKIMEASRDHGFTNGLVIPCFSRDRIGRVLTSSAVAYWSEGAEDFERVVKEKQFHFQLAMTYWTTAIMRIARPAMGRIEDCDTMNGQPLVVITLTDRERDVLSFAALGLTVGQTANRLGIGHDTVSTYLTNAQRKLNTSNKTHTVVAALQLGLIDL